MMMKKIFFFYCFLLLSQLTKSQDFDIKNSTGTVLPDKVYFCGNKTMDLKVSTSYTTAAGDYQITPITTNFPRPVNLVSFSNTTGDNHFSRVLNLPFNFNIDGIDYSKVVVGSNGRLIFGKSTDSNIDNLHTFTDKVHSGNDATSTQIKIPNIKYGQLNDTNPSYFFDLPQIFFGFTDLRYYNPAAYSNVTYGNISVGSLRGFAISITGVTERTIGTGYDKPYSCMIVLVEDGSFYINAAKNNNQKNALIGIQNSSATKGFWPVNSEPTSVYNNDKWLSNSNEFWKFSPVLAPISYTADWYIYATKVATGNNYTIDLNGSIDLKVVLTYSNGIVKDKTIKFSDFIPSGFNISYQACGVKSVFLSTGINESSTLNYQWYFNGSQITGETASSHWATNTGTYKLVSQSKFFPECTVESSRYILIEVPDFNTSDKYICSSTNSPQLIDLNSYYPPGQSYTGRFYENGILILDGKITIQPNSTRTFTLDSRHNDTNCGFSKTFNVVYTSLPASTEITRKYCYGASTVDVTKWETDFTATPAAFTIKYSLDGINFNNDGKNINPATNKTVWVSFSSSNCAGNSISKINLVEGAQVVIKPITPFPPHCFSSTEYFDLNVTKSELEYASNIKATFYRDIALTDQINNLNYRGSGKVYIKIDDTTSGCFNSTMINLVIYPKPALIKNSPETKLPKTCGSTVYDLSTDIKNYIGNWNQYSEIRYYDGTGNRMTAPSQWQNYDTQISGANPYMIFVYNQTNNLECSDRINFDLKSLVKPVAIISQILVCSELTYSLQDFKNKVITNSSNYTFTDLSGNQLPSNFNLSVLPLSVKFLMKDIASGCVSDPQIVTFFKGANSAILTTETNYILCDDDFDGRTSFNLDSKKSVFTNNATAIFEYFKDSGLTQSITSTYTNEIAFNQTVFAKITISGFCPEIVKIHLKVNTPSKSTTLLNQYFICYGEELPINGGDENDKWEWSTGETTQRIKIKTPGNYSVKLTNSAKGCSYTHNFVVSDENQPRIEVINQTANSIEVIANGGEKPYKYYFNGVPQNSNILMNPTESTYTVQVESATGCKGEPKSIYFIKIFNAFTPNSDGINDTWTIENLDKMENISLVIVDRYRTKLFESQDKNNLTWDGKIGGRALPTASYWYSVSWFDSVTQKTEQRQGWILLKNRN